VLVGGGVDRLGAGSLARGALAGLTTRRAVGSGVATVITGVEAVAQRPVTLSGGVVAVDGRGAAASAGIAFSSTSSAVTAICVQVASAGVVVAMGGQDVPGIGEVVTASGQLIVLSCQGPQAIRIACCILGLASEGRRGVLEAGLLDEELLAPGGRLIGGCTHTISLASAPAKPADNVLYLRVRPEDANAWR